MDENNHFTRRVKDDSLLLLDRYIFFYQKSGLIPNDEGMLKYFRWTKDHLNRCYQYLKEIGVLTYARNNRRHTLQFLGDYARLNRVVKIKREVD